MKDSFLLPTPHWEFMFRKVLIANRGEIAVRIIRACRDLGISPVAVYSEPDRTSLHVRMADEAYLLGPAPSIESYLNIEKVIETAGRAGADAIHPGYGFLSENPNFAAACENSGIPMIGPSAESMRLIGTKTSARALLRQHSIPLVPGTHRSLESADEAIEEARILGYPVMIKAVAGGGGKGMRLVKDESLMAADFTAAGSEALNSFGDPSLYLEKYVTAPRHIEIQVLADRRGNVIFLGERDCSIQRRHQKVLEECPSPFLDEGLRRRMGEVAVRVARAVNYENAGTVEFLVDSARNFYFLEMNTRLQVEHPVTEAVTGVDIVCEQFKIANGEPLSLSQDQVHMRGWAVECRIYAEDPDRGLLPSPGVIRRLQEPMGTGVRLDSGIYQGWEVSIHYDPLLAKLTTFGTSREQAISRMSRAIQEYRIGGIKTNIPLLLEILRSEGFLAGKTHTEFVDEMYMAVLSKKEHAAPVFQPYALAAALAYSERTESSPKTGSPESPNAWKLSGRPGFSTARHR
jgi:acetyl-CoA carboxylase biotin carboxylase subunit